MKAQNFVEGNGGEMRSDLAGVFFINSEGMAPESGLSDVIKGLTKLIDDACVSLRREINVNTSRHQISGRPAAYVYDDALSRDIFLL